MIKIRTRSLTALLFSVASIQTASAADTEKTPWNHWEYGNSTLETHGYFRSDIGTDFDGHTLAYFQAPGATSKYRLGNESDSNLEVALDYRYFLDGVGNPESRYLKLYGMVADYQTNPNYDKMDMRIKDDNISQAYVLLGNALGKGVNAWVGRRYYDRIDIHTIDHFWLNAAQGAQVGGGLEGLYVGGPGTLDIALFESKDEDIANRNGGPLIDDLYTYSLDARYRGIPTNTDGQLTLWSQLASRPASSAIGYRDQYGYSVGGWHTQKNVAEGDLTNAVTFRHGAAVVQGDFNSRAVREDQNYALNEAYVAETNAAYFYERPNKDYGIQWVAVARHEEHGADAPGAGSTITWLSTGARPIFALNDNFSIATNVGVDYVDNTVVGREGFLGVGSVALQFTDEKGYFNRPVARLFLTSAAWSDDLEGAVGNAPDSTVFNDKQHGVTVGFQVEHWW